MTDESTDEERRAVRLALGRILRLGSRPERPGDLEEYERCRAIILNIAGEQPLGYSHNYVRDRRRGAAGD